MENQLPQPKTQTAEVLYEFLHSDSLTRSDFFKSTHILNVTARIADLRKLGLNIICEHKNVQNKFGRKVSFGAWSLAKEDKEKAVKIYRTINQG